MYCISENVSAVFGPSTFLIITFLSLRLISIICGLDLVLLDAAVEGSVEKVRVALTNGADVMRPGIVVIDPEIEVAVLVFCDDTPAELIRTLVPISAEDLTSINFPASIQHLIVGRTFEAIQRFAVEEQFEALTDLLLRQGVRFSSRFRFASGDCTA